MKTKIITLSLILAASIAQAGQPTISAAALANASRQPTPAEMQSKGSGIRKGIICGVVKGAVRAGVNPTWAPIAPLVKACKK